jgi:hypothetical protein
MSHVCFWFNSLLYNCHYKAGIVFEYSDSWEFFFENPRLKLPPGLCSHLSGPQNVIVLGVDSRQHLKKCEKNA